MIFAVRFMKYIKSIFAGFLIFSGFIFAQSGDNSKNPLPVKWKVIFNKTSVSIGDEITLILKGDIAEHQHMYANEFECDPIPFKLLFEKNSSYMVIGSPKSIGAKKYKDEIFGCEVKDFEKRAEIHQKIKILKKEVLLKLAIDYQTCTESMCLSFKDNLTVPKIEINESNKTIDTATIQNTDTSKDNTISENTDTNTKNTEINKTDNSTKTDFEKLDEKSLWSLFLLGIGGGLLALLTPCVFPMIPMTVAYFTKQKDKVKGKKMAVFYGLSILIISLVLGLALAAFLGEAFTNKLSTHWLPNIIFFLIFMLFAASFLGMFEIVLPASFVNKMDKQGDRGGYIGIFFIAFTLVLVSFSCTVPIVGSVAILASKGEFIRPFFAMLGFGLMFALPFTLFAFFPQWLSSLPKSGGWLNSIKVVLGILEIALALKFLSQADIVYHWRILDRDVFLAIWISLSVILGLYLLGKIKFSHDSDLPYISVPRFTFAMLSFAFAFYLLPGMWGAPLRHLSGVLPPMNTQDFSITNNSTIEKKEHSNTARFSDILHLPHGLSGYYYYNEGIEAAKKEGKPIFIDFTGHGCANCRRMEEYVWVKPDILKMLNEDFIIISLYVDERAELGKSEWITKPDGSILKTLGEQNADMQVNKFKSNGQPYYYIIDSNEKILSVFNGYDPDSEKFKEFLINGKNKFDK